MRHAVKDGDRAAGIDYLASFNDAVIVGSQLGGARGAVCQR